MTYTLITANRNYSSWSLRPWVLMKALGVPFADRIEPFTKPSNYEEFRAFSPTGQVPVLIDGARTVWDSLGIVLYLADRHQGIWPNSDYPEQLGVNALIGAWLRQQLPVQCLARGVQCGRYPRQVLVRAGKRTARAGHRPSAR